MRTALQAVAIATLPLAGDEMMMMMMMLLLLMLLLIAIPIDVERFSYVISPKTCSMSM